jgi:hypothetical protein
MEPRTITLPVTFRVGNLLALGPPGSSGVGRRRLPRPPL